MANKNKLKGYFETGDVPNQSQYQELIDSQLNLTETGTQILVGTLSSSFLEVENHITASGNISASGNIISNNVEVNGNITASGNISSSGVILANQGNFNYLLTGVEIGEDQVSGTNTDGILNIAASSLAYKSMISFKAASTQQWSLGMGINSSGENDFVIQEGTNAALFATDAFIITKDNKNVGINYQAGTDLPSKLSVAGDITTTHITASGNISSSGEVYAQQYFIENRSILDYSTSGEILRLGYNNDTEMIVLGREGVVTNGILLDANITASGDISSSGTIISDNSLIVNRQYFEAYGGSNIHFIKAGNNLVLANGGLTTSEITASGNFKVDGSQVDFTNLPTSDPSVAGRLYRDGTDLKISLG
jgi:hypothetical protein